MITEVDIDIKVFKTCSSSPTMTLPPVYLDLDLLIAWWRGRRRAWRGRWSGGTSPYDSVINMSVMRDDLLDDGRPNLRL